MPSLMVVGFKKDMYRAAVVLNRLIDLGFDWTVDLGDAVAVYRDYSGRLRVDQSYQMATAERATIGHLLCSLIGLTLGAINTPFTARENGRDTRETISAASAGGAAEGAVNARWWREEFSLGEGFIADVGTLVQPGDSAIFALLRTADPDCVTAEVRGYGGTVVQSLLTLEQSSKVQTVLEGRSRFP